jgi:hypothetical protein
VRRRSGGRLIGRGSAKGEEIEDRRAIRPQWGVSV